MPNGHAYPRQFEPVFNPFEAESGGDSLHPRTSRRKLHARAKSGKTLNGMARLRVENGALRNHIIHLETQWDSLKATLGVLSTTVGSHESFF